MRFHFIAGEILYPVKAVDLNYRNETFEDLVAFEAGENDPRGEPKMHCHKREGDNHQENENQVVFENEGYISAALDKPGKAGCLVAGSDNGDGNDVDEASCVCRCLKADDIKLDEWVFEQLDNRACQHSEGEEEQLNGVSILPYEMALSFSYRLSRNDSDGA